MEGGDSNKWHVRHDPFGLRHSVPSAETDLLRRLTIVIVLGFLFLSAFAKLNLIYSHKFFNLTGNAAWIWPRVELSRELPVAFFATRDFDIPAVRYYTKIKILGDPDYTLYFNGREIGARRTGDEGALDVYDVSGLAKTGRNRIVVAVRSVNGVGGLIAGVDFSPETENVVVTDRRWSLFTHWTPSLLARDLGVRASPMEIGRPPIGRWNYPGQRAVALEQPSAGARSVRQVFPETMMIHASLPIVKEVGGTAIVSQRPVHATVYDFGPSAGRLRLTRTQDVSLTQVVPVRFANTVGQVVAIEGEVRTFVFAGGEPTIEDHEVRQFRYVVVYDRPAIAEVMR
jgi:hypothetical protein